jgi:hypothetical protein
MAYIDNNDTGADVRAALNALVDISTLDAGEALTAGDVVYLKSSDGKWWKTDADAEATSSGQVGVVVANADAEAAVQVRIRGPIADTGLTVGPYYLSGTAGAKTATAPGNLLQVQRKLGWATAADSFYVSPDDTYIVNDPSVDISLVTDPEDNEYTLLAGDLGKIVEISAAESVGLIIPTYADMPAPVGSSFDVIQVGAGVVTVVGDDGVDVRGEASTPAQWRGVTVYKRDEDEWVCIGGAS